MSLKSSILNSADRNEARAALVTAAKVTGGKGKTFNKCRSAYNRALELQAAARRSESARKAAATRKANALAPKPVTATVSRRKTRKTQEAVLVS